LDVVFHTNSESFDSPGVENLITKKGNDEHWHAKVNGFFDGLLATLGNEEANFFVG